jgi:hypothetical protein
MAKDPPAERIVQPDRCPDCGAVIPAADLDLLVWSDGTLRVICPACRANHLLIAAMEGP